MSVKYIGTTLRALNLEIAFSENLRKNVFLSFLDIISLFGEKFVNFNYFQIKPKRMAKIDRIDLARHKINIYGRTEAPYKKMVIGKHVPFI